MDKLTKNKNVLAVFIKEVDEVLYLAEAAARADADLVRRMRELRNGYLPILKKGLGIK